MAMQQRSKDLWRQLKKQRLLQCFALAGMAYLLVFSYLPMAGLVMAVSDYNIATGIPGMVAGPWVGLKHFLAFFNNYEFEMLLRNTVALSLLKLLFSFPIPIVFAIMLNEVRQQRFKRVVQTLSYLPHFISWVIVSGLALNFLSNDRGVINLLLRSLRLIDKPIPFLTSAQMYWPLAVFLDVWKDMGWWTIIYLAAITGVDLTMYEAAEIDGAGRFRKIWSITLPSIRGTVTVVMILALGNLFGGGLSGSNFEQSYLLGNTMNYQASEVIQTHVFRYGLSKFRYSYATAVGLIQSFISLVLIFTSNWVASKVSESTLF